MPALEIKSGTLFYQRTGQGRPVILLHAILADHRMWEKLVEALSPEFDVIALDFQGHGQSSAGEDPITTRLLAEDVIGLMDQLGLERVSLVGASLGGTVGSLVAALAPERVARLGLMSTWYEPNSVVSSYLETMLAAVMAPETFADFYVESFKQSIPPPSDGALRLLRRMAPRPGPSVARVIPACERHDAGSLLERIRADVLVIVGSEDPLKECQDPIRRALPDIAFRTVPGGGHNLMFDKPAFVVPVIREFLTAP